MSTMLEEQSWTHKLLLMLAQVDILQVSINAEPSILYKTHCLFVYLSISILECVPLDGFVIRKTERKFLICCGGRSYWLLLSVSRRVPGHLHCYILRLSYVFSF